MKWLPCKHENLPSIPRTQKRKQNRADIVVSPCNSTAGVMKMGPGACRTLSSLAGVQVERRPGFKQNVTVLEELHTPGLSLVSACMHVGVFTYKCGICMYTQMPHPLLTHTLILSCIHNVHVCECIIASQTLRLPEVLRADWPCFHHPNKNAELCNLQRGNGWL